MWLMHMSSVVLVHVQGLMLLPCVGVLARGVADVCHSQCAMTHTECVVKLEMADESLLVRHGAKRC